MQFALTDFFVAGLGLDLVGAAVLARGLIPQAEVIVQRETVYWADGRVSPLSSFATAEDRIDAQCGVIVVGFAFQAVGYLLDLGFGSGSAHSAQRAVTASVRDRVCGDGQAPRSLQRGAGQGLDHALPRPRELAGHERNDQRTRHARCQCYGARVAVPEHPGSHPRVHRAAATSCAGACVDTDGSY